MVGISHQLPPTAAAAHRQQPPAPGPARETPLPGESVDLNSTAENSGASTVGKLLIGTGTLGFLGLVGGVLAGMMATPAVFVVGAVASVLAVGAGGLMASSGSEGGESSGSMEAHLSTEGRLSQNLRLGEPAGAGQVQQSLDLSSGQVRQEINVGSGHYLDPSTGRLVYHL